MVKMPENGFVSISITKNLTDRADELYRKAGFATRSGYIQDRLRRAIERDEVRIRNNYGDEGAEKS